MLRSRLQVNPASVLGNQVVGNFGGTLDSVLGRVFVSQYLCMDFATLELRL